VIVIIFGVSAAGKTTIGKLLAEDLNWRFYEADDFHARANIEKMRSGCPLTDKTDGRGWTDCAARSPVLWRQRRTRCLPALH
jgi:gluconokinase